MMTPADAAELLTLASAYDNRKPSREVSQAWAAALRNLEPMECHLAIVSHYTESSAWLMPAMIRERVEAERRRISAEVLKLPEPSWLVALEGEEYVRRRHEWLRDMTARMRRGEQIAVEAPGPVTTRALGPVLKALSKSKGGRRTELPEQESA
ncbi:MAG: hypothetical protein EOP24_39000 [Hyphomicrobiales bacterium]|nr:MAG: hypothetical protein EOP24_39000 [Hyphomicrobiales bacterium]